MGRFPGAVKQQYSKRSTFWNGREKVWNWKSLLFPAALSAIMTMDGTTHYQTARYGGHDFSVISTTMRPIDKALYAEVNEYCEAWVLISNAFYQCGSGTITVTKIFVREASWHDYKTGKSMKRQVMEYRFKLEF